MAVLDAARRLVTLSHRELAAATVVAGNGGGDQLRADLRPDMAALEEAGAVVDGSLVPAVAEIVGVVSRPQLRVTLETFVAATVVLHAAWATPDVAVVGRSVADDSLEYSVTDPVSLPFALAALVGLGRRPTAGGGTLTASVESLDAAAAPAENGELDEARDRLAHHGVPTPTAGVLAGVLSARRLTWRASGVWMDEAGAVHTASVTVVDAGEAGLWRCEVEGGGQDGPGAAVSLRPMAPSHAWRALTDLLPVRRSAR